MSIHGPIARDDLPGLTARICSSLQAVAPASVLCEVSGVPGDAVSVDALARLQLGARRHGCVVHLRGASAELRRLVELMGLSEVLLADG